MASFDILLEAREVVNSEIAFPASRVLDCGHCGNRTPHSKVHEYEHLQLFEEVEEEKWYETFKCVSYACGTCGGMNLYGGFYGVIISQEDFPRTRLHPKTFDLLPPSHLISPADPIPNRIVRLYEEVWPLRYRSPSAFAGQIRRLLEYISSDQNAIGNTLFEKLEHLVSSGVFPGNFANMTDLLRRVGNIGAHAMEEDVSVWDAELIDDFFRSVVEYVYIAPAKIERMRERLSGRKKSSS